MAEATLSETDDKALTNHISIARSSDDLDFLVRLIPPLLTSVTIKSEDGVAVQAPGCTGVELANQPAQSSETQYLGEKAFEIGIEDNRRQSSAGGSEVGRGRGVSRETGYWRT